jgi:hypothetical protein
VSEKTETIEKMKLKRHKIKRFKKGVLLLKRLVIYIDVLKNRKTTIVKAFKFINDSIVEIDEQ